MLRVVVLGGGFGGIAAALTLRERLDQGDEVVLIERDTTFVMGLRKNWGLLGVEQLSAGERPLAALRDRGIRVVQGTITAIDAGARAVEVDGGERIDGAALVVALGAERVPDAIPGFREHAIDAYDRTAIPRGAEAIAAFGGGRLLIGIFGTPYPCPPGPFELAILLDEHLRARGVRPEMAVFTPLALSLPILGKAGCAGFESWIMGLGIDLLRERRATAVEPGAVVAGEERLPFDLLLGVPPHRVPKLLVEAGLAEPGGWVKVHPRTLETAVPGVWAVGDCTAIPLSNGMALPKAGAFAHAQGEVVAHRIADTLGRRSPDRVFAGLGTCFLESGMGMASAVTGDFLAEPIAVELTEPTLAAMDAKRAFERDRLTAWFGG